MNLTSISIQISQPCDHSPTIAVSFPFLHCRHRTAFSSLSYPTSTLSQTSAASQNGCLQECSSSCNYLAGKRCLCLRYQHRHPHHGPSPPAPRVDQRSCKFSHPNPPHRQMVTLLKFLSKIKGGNLTENATGIICQPNLFQFAVDTHLIDGISYLKGRDGYTEFGWHVLQHPSSSPIANR